MDQQAISEMPTRRPRIGVTSADDPAPDNYVAAVVQCGGEAIVLKNNPGSEEIDLADLDGLVVTGGSDIDPRHYGAPPHSETKTGDPARDAYELAMIRAAFAADVPTLAICRGMQVANVAWGGSLNQHLPDVVDGLVVHDDPARKFETFSEHTVDVVADSLLCTLSNSQRFATNASHHQSIHHLGEGLRAVARTEDGTIEALERPDAKVFWLATQWHPERLLSADEGRSSRVFEAFIDAARAFAAKKLPV